MADTSCPFCAIIMGEGPARVVYRDDHAVALRAAVAPDGLNIIQSSGAAATQTVPHLHVHLVPRWAADAMGPIWPAEPPSYPSQVLDNLRDKLAGLM